MEYRRLGRTGLKVSELCLGSMQFGWTADEEASFQIMDAFFEAGGNFLDTADIYSRWHPGNPGGLSETIIGRWMRVRGNRHQVIIATKVRGRMWDGPNGEGLSRAHILKAIEDSLRRLDTEAIDLYQAHWYDAETPIDETLRALDDLVRQGKVRYIGASNYPAWRMMQALWMSDRLGLARFDSLQPHYNYVHRAEFERELAEVCQDQGIGVIPYSPLAGGFLTGKYHQGMPLPRSERAEGIQRRYFGDPKAWIGLDRLEEVARGHGKTITQTALAWLLSQPGITAPIVGANSAEQLKEILGACGFRLSAEEKASLNRATEWRELEDN